MKILPRKQDLPSRQHHKSSLILKPKPNLLFIIFRLDLLSNLLILCLLLHLLINQKYLFEPHISDIESLCCQSLMTFKLPNSLEQNGSRGR
jgi:hypothetical protein